MDGITFFEDFDGILGGHVIFEQKQSLYFGGKDNR